MEPGDPGHLSSNISPSHIENAVENRSSSIAKKQSSSNEVILLVRSSRVGILIHLMDAEGQRAQALW